MMLVNPNIMTLHATITASAGAGTRCSILSGFETALGLAVLQRRELPAPHPAPGGPILGQPVAHWMQRPSGTPRTTPRC